MKKSRLYKISNYQISIFVALGIALVVSVIVLENASGPIFLPIIMVTCTVAAMIGTAIALIKLQRANMSTLTLRPDDIDPGTVFRVIKSNMEGDKTRCIGFEDRFIYQLASAENENNRYLLETTSSLPESEDGYLIKSAAGDFSPYTGDVKSMKEDQN